jgi:hypothetical protein
MKIENLTDLKNLINLCYKLDVKELSIGDIKLSLGNAPNKRIKTKKQDTSPSILEQIETPDVLTEEELLYYSSGTN